jgi:diguanylate cyclase (GGDEF)-like protein
LITDITARKETEERLHYLATHDLLTNLPNRTLFIDRLQDAIWNAEQKEMMVAILFMDLDGFKAINDMYGHAFGDEYLSILAKRLKNILAESDTIARLGGDEFAILLRDINAQEDTVCVAERILKMLSKPIVIKGQELQTSASIGISIYPDHSTEHDLLTSADLAMYKAKSNGKNRYYIHTPDLVS